MKNPTIVIMFLGFVIVLTFSLFYILKNRFLSKLYASKEKTIFLRKVLFFGFFFMVSAMLGKNFQNQNLFTQYYIYFCFLIFGFIMYLTILVLMRDIIVSLISYRLLLSPVYWLSIKDKFVSKFLKKNKAKLRAGGEHNADLFSHEIDPLSRKQFLYKATGLAMFTATPVIAGVSVMQARSSLHVIKKNVYIENLPESFDGLTIAQISDLHVGLTIRKSYVEEVVKKVNDQKPHLVFLTGDMMDGDVSQLEPDMRPLNKLKTQIKDGRYFVTGNHEYISGVDQWLDYFDKNSFNVLKNEHRILTQGKDKIAICGVYDYNSSRYSSHKCDVSQSVKGLDANITKILLAHQPKTIYQANKNKIDFMCCGHTHGGQIFPVNILVKLIQPYTRGLHLHDYTQIYVNQGTGYWGPPMRLGTSCEISLFTIKKGKRSKK